MVLSINREARFPYDRLGNAYRAKVFPSSGMCPMDMAFQVATLKISSDSELPREEWGEIIDRHVPTIFT